MSESVTGRGTLVSAGLSISRYRHAAEGRGTGNP